jgi:hypothetical protein
MLIGSVRNLTSVDQITRETVCSLSQGVYPPLFHSFAKNGLYCFRFYKEGGWRYVVIDDFLPFFCREDGTLNYIFGQCSSAFELWVPLIEKAYAKLHGCYEALNGGVIEDALVDLTGELAEKRMIRTMTESREAVENLWK